MLALLWLWPQGQVGYLFDIKRVPWSVSSVRCKSIFTSDILLTCAFEVGPRDLPKLLAGESFSIAEPTYAHVQDFGMALDLGENFVPAYHYVAKPKDSPYGGSLDVFTNQERTRVLAHLYIE